eukprot:Sspe_Gene.91634::Locus_63194_Transcript_1_1_Confidence_1.000_Length_3596::g.91634::m.91634
MPPRRSKLEDYTESSRSGKSVSTSPSNASLASSVTSTSHSTERRRKLFAAPSTPVWPRVFEEPLLSVDQLFIKDTTSYFVLLQLLQTFPLVTAAFVARVLKAGKASALVPPSKYQTLQTAYGILIPRGQEGRPIRLLDLSRILIEESVGLQHMLHDALKLSGVTLKPDGKLPKASFMAFLSTFNLQGILNEVILQSKVSSIESERRAELLKEERTAFNEGPVRFYTRYILMVVKAVMIQRRWRTCMAQKKLRRLVEVQVDIKRHVEASEGYTVAKSVWWVTRDQMVTLLLESETFHFGMLSYVCSGLRPRDPLPDKDYIWLTRCYKVTPEPPQGCSLWEMRRCICSRKQSVLLQAKDALQLIGMKPGERAVKLEKVVDFMQRCHMSAAMRRELLHNKCLRELEGSLTHGLLCLLQGHVRERQCRLLLVDEEIAAFADICNREAFLRMTGFCLSNPYARNDKKAASKGLASYQNNRELLLSDDRGAYNKIVVCQRVARVRLFAIRRRKAAVTIQKCWRGRQQRGRYLKMRGEAREQVWAAATAIQREWRRADARRRYVALRSAARRLQRLGRGLRWRQLIHHRVAEPLRCEEGTSTAARDADADIALTSEAAGEADQGVPRGSSEDRRSLLDRVIAGYSSRVAMARLRAATRETRAAEILQRRWRCVMSRARLRLLRMRKATELRRKRSALLCAQLREHKVEKETINTHRRFLARVCCGYKARVAVHKAYTKKHCEVIQRAWKVFAARRVAEQRREELLQRKTQRHNTSTKMKNALRAHRLLKERTGRHNLLRTQVKPALLLQRVARGWLGRRAVSRVAATALLQRVARGGLARGRLRTSAAAAVIQRNWRCGQARQAASQRRAAVVLSRVGRGYVARRALQRSLVISAAAALQRVLRGAAVRRRLAQLRAAVRLQRVAKGAVTRTRLREMLAAMTIQRGWRCRTAKHEACSIRKATATLSRLVRGAVARIKLFQLRAAVVLQRVGRSAAARARLREAAAAATIQRGWRCCRATREVGCRRRAAALLARLLRGAAARLKLFQLQQQHLRGVGVLQRLGRGLACRALLREAVAARTIQRGWRQHEACMKADRRRRAAAVLTRVVRGGCTRMKLSRLRVVRTLQRLGRGAAGRVRLREVAAAATIQRGWRCLTAK